MKEIKRVLLLMASIMPFMIYSDMVMGIRWDLYSNIEIVGLIICLLIVGYAINKCDKEN